MSWLGSIQKVAQKAQDAAERAARDAQEASKKAALNAASLAESAHAAAQVAAAGMQQGASSLAQGLQLITDETTGEYVTEIGEGNVGFNIRGNVVTSIAEGGIAEQAGIEVGDNIVAVSGKFVPVVPDGLSPRSEKRERKAVKQFIGEKLSGERPISITLYREPPGEEDDADKDQSKGDVEMPVEVALADDPHGLIDQAAATIESADLESLLKAAASAQLPAQFGTAEYSVQNVAEVQQSGRTANGWDGDFGGLDLLGFPAASDEGGPQTSGSGDLLRDIPSDAGGATEISGWDDFGGLVPKPDSEEAALDADAGPVLSSWNEDFGGLDLLGGRDAPEQDIARDGQPQPPRPQQEQGHGVEPDSEEVAFEPDAVPVLSGWSNDFGALDLLGAPDAAEQNVVGETQPKPPGLQQAQTHGVEHDSEKVAFEADAGPVLSGRNNDFGALDLLGVPDAAEQDVVGETQPKPPGPQQARTQGVNPGSEEAALDADAGPVLSGWGDDFGSLDLLGVPDSGEQDVVGDSGEPPRPEQEQGTGFQLVSEEAVLVAGFGLELAGAGNHAAADADFNLPAAEIAHAGSNPSVPDVQLTSERRLSRMHPQFLKSPAALDADAPPVSSGWGDGPGGLEVASSPSSAEPDIGDTDSVPEIADSNPPVAEKLVCEGLELPGAHFPAEPGVDESDSNPPVPKIDVADSKPAVPDEQASEGLELHGAEIKIPTELAVGEANSNSSVPEINGADSKPAVPDEQASEGTNLQLNSEAALDADADPVLSGWSDGFEGIDLQLNPEAAPDTDAGPVLSGGSDGFEGVALPGTPNLASQCVGNADTNPPGSEFDDADGNAPVPEKLVAEGIDTQLISEEAADPFFSGWSGGFDGLELSGAPNPAAHEDGDTNPPKPDSEETALDVDADAGPVQAGWSEDFGGLDLQGVSDVAEVVVGDAQPRLRPQDEQGTDFQFMSEGAPPGTDAAPFHSGWSEGLGGLGLDGAETPEAQDVADANFNPQVPIILHDGSNPSMPENVVTEGADVQLTSERRLTRMHPQFLKSPAALDADVAPVWSGWGDGPGELEATGAPSMAEQDFADADCAPEIDDADSNPPVPEKPVSEGLELPGAQISAETCVGEADSNPPVPEIDVTDSKPAVPDEQVSEGLELPGSHFPAKPGVDESAKPPAPEVDGADSEPAVPDEQASEALELPGAQIPAERDADKANSNPLAPEGDGADFEPAVPDEQASEALELPGAQIPAEPGAGEADFNPPVPEIDGADTKLAVPNEKSSEGTNLQHNSEAALDADDADPVLSGWSDGFEGIDLQLNPEAALDTDAGPVLSGGSDGFEEVQFIGIADANPPVPERAVPENPIVEGFDVNIDSEDAAGPVLSGCSDGFEGLELSGVPSPAAQNDGDADTNPPKSDSDDVDCKAPVSEKLGSEGGDSQLMSDEAAGPVLSGWNDGLEGLELSGAPCPAAQRDRDPDTNPPKPEIVDADCKPPVPQKPDSEGFEEAAGTASEVTSSNCVRVPDSTEDALSEQPRFAAELEESRRQMASQAQDLAAASDDRKRLLEELEESKRQITNETQDLASAENERKRLSEELEESRRQIANQTQDMVSAENERKRLSEELEGSRRQSTDQTQDLAAAENDRKRLSEELEESRRQITNQTQDTASVNASWENALNVVEELRARLVSVESALEDAKDRACKAEKELASEGEEKTAINNARMGLEDEVDQLWTRLEQATSQASSSQEKHEALHEAHKHLKEELGLRCSELESIREQLALTTHELASGKRREEELTAKVEALSGSLEASSSQTSEAAGKCAKLIEETQKSRSALEEVLSARQLAEQRAASLEEELQKERQNISQLRSDSEGSARQAEQQSLESAEAASKLEKTLAGVQAELKSSQNRIRALETEHQGSREKCEEIASNANTKEERFNAAKLLLDARAESLESQLAQSQQEGDALKKNLEDLGREFSTVSRECETLRSAALGREGEELLAGRLEEEMNRLRPQLANAEEMVETTSKKAKKDRYDTDYLLAASREEISDISARLQTKTAEVESTRQQCDELQAKLELVQKEAIQKLEAQMEEAKSERANHKQLVRTFQLEIAEREKTIELVAEKARKEFAIEREASKQEIEELRQSRADLRSAVGIATIGQLRQSPEHRRNEPDPGVIGLSFGSSGGTGCSEEVQPPSPENATAVSEKVSSSLTDVNVSARVSSEVAALQDNIAVLERRCCTLQRKLNERQPVDKAGTVPYNPLLLEGGGVDGKSNSPLWLQAIVLMLRRFSENLVKNENVMLVFYAHLLLLYILAACFLYGGQGAAAQDCISMSLQQAPGALPALNAATPGGG